MLESEIPVSQPGQAEILERLHDHIIICGLRNLGYRILEQLRGARIDVVVIDNEPELRFAEEAISLNVPLIRRDSRTETALTLAGISRARAIITVADDDLKNLETVLEASRLAPNVRAVASFSNSQIGEQIINTLPNAHALSLPELTATTFVTASLPNQVLHLFEIGTEEVAVVADRPNQPGSISALYGKIVPIQVERDPLLRTGNPQEDVTVCPSPNKHVQPSDTVFLIGRSNDLVTAEEVKLDRRTLELSRSGNVSLQPEAGIRQRVRQRKAQERSGRIGRWWRLFRRSLRTLERPFRFVLVFLIILLIISTLIFLWAKGGNVVDALYTSVNVVTGENTLEKDVWEIKLYGVLLTLVGTALLTVIYGYVTNYIVSARIAEALGQQKATDMKDHVVLSGLDTVGYFVLRGLLERGERVVVVERDADNRYVNLVRNMGVPVLQADARLSETLDLVNVTHARCITILTNDDLANLETALNARQKNRQLRVVLRLFDRGLAEKIENRFSIQIARSTSALAAPYFIASALNYEVVTTFYVHQTPFIVTRLVIRPGGALDGLTVKKLYSRTGILVMAYYHPPRPALQPNTPLMPRAEQVMVHQITPQFYPDPEQFVLHGGDTIYFVGPYDRITSVYKLNS